MLTPIRPSLSQALLRQGGTAAPQSGTPEQADARNAALEAQRAFFRNVTGQVSAPSAPQAATVRPAVNAPAPQAQSLRAQIDAANNRPAASASNVIKAAEIARARTSVAEKGETPAPLRPGSLLNIVV